MLSANGLVKMDPLCSYLRMRDSTAVDPFRPTADECRIACVPTGMQLLFEIHELCSDQQLTCLERVGSIRQIQLIVYPEVALVQVASELLDVLSRCSQSITIVVLIDAPFLMTHSAELLVTLRRLLQPLARFPQYAIQDIWINRASAMPNIPFQSEEDNFLLPCATCVNALQFSEPEAADIRAWLRGALAPTWNLVHHQFSNPENRQLHPLIPRVEAVQAVNRMLSCRHRSRELRFISVRPAFPFCGLTTALMCLAKDFVPHFRVYFFPSNPVQPVPWEQVFRRLARAKQPTLLVLDKQDGLPSRHDVELWAGDQLPHTVIVSPETFESQNQVELNPFLSNSQLQNVCTAYSAYCQDAQVTAALRDLFTGVKATGPESLDRHVLLPGLTAFNKHYTPAIQLVENLLDHVNRLDNEFRDIYLGLAGLATLCSNLSRVEVLNTCQRFVQASVLAPVWPEEQSRNRHVELMKIANASSLLSVTRTERVHCVSFVHPLFARLYLQLSWQFDVWSPARKFVELFEFCRKLISVWKERLGGLDVKSLFRHILIARKDSQLFGNLVHTLQKPPPRETFEIIDLFRPVLAEAHFLVLESRMKRYHLASLEPRDSLALLDQAVELADEAAELTTEVSVRQNQAESRSGKNESESEIVLDDPQISRS
eukprot:m.137047 g.137047  ORF g.137047 m.137047 type:complete len:657 (+) comp52489_c0_seq1:1660-3630(+)